MLSVWSSPSVKSTSLFPVYVRSKWYREHSLVDFLCFGIPVSVPFFCESVAGGRAIHQELADGKTYKLLQSPWISLPPATLSQKKHNGMGCGGRLL